MLPIRKTVQSQFARLAGLSAGAPPWLRVPPLPVTAAASCGIVGGIALGAVVGPVGVALGMWLGVSVGAIAGKVITSEDAKSSARTRELDDIIGITHGTLGAGADALSKMVTDDGDDFDNFAASPYSDRETWAAEWLTPPPPVAG